MDTRAQQQSGARSQTSRLPAGLVNSSQIIPATAPSNHFTYPISCSITAQSSSSLLKPPEAYNADFAVERTYNKSESVKEDARGNEDTASPNSEAFPTNSNRGYTTSIAAPCPNSPHLSGGRELSPSLHGYSAQESPPESPSFQQPTQSITRSALDIIQTDQPLQPPQSETVPEQEDDIAFNSGWTRKRLRSQAGRVIQVSERRDDNPVQAPSVSSSIERARKGKAAKASRSFKTAQYMNDDPIDSIARRIGHSDGIGEMQQIIYAIQSELQGGAYQALAPAQPLSGATVPSSQGLMRLLHLVPTVARRIEESTFCEQLSRIRNRMALAEFYSAYYTAQQQPDEFLRAVDQILPTVAAPNQTKKTRVKNRFIDLVFDQSRGNRNRKKDSTRINDW